MTPLKYKNDTDTPSVLEVWVLEGGPGLQHMEKYPVKRQQCFLILKELFIMASPKIFIVAKLSRSNLV